MKKRIFFLLALSAWTPVQTLCQTPTRVLFLGNSYTNVNDLPGVFQDFSEAGGQDIDVMSNTPGGYTFSGHTTNQQSLDLIAQGTWDFVVLQEQSQIPSFPIAQVQSDCFPYAAALNDLIEADNPCAETVFYMTWGRENGDASNCSFWPPVCTYEGMDSLLAERYMQMGADNDAIVSPVGAVWRYIRSEFPGIDLYAGDGSHPSAAGTYAAACTFYAVIHRKDPALVAWDYQLNALQALQIRYAASVIAYDSLSRWFVGDYDTTTTAAFSFDTNGLTATFNNQSTNAALSQWDFGDGSSSTHNNPVHAYAQPGDYLVLLTTTYCDSTDTAQAWVRFEGIPIDTADTISGVSHFEAINMFTLVPNPATDRIFIVQRHDSTTGNSTPPLVRIYDLQGRLVHTARDWEVLVEHVNPGAYVVRIDKDRGMQSLSLIRQ